ncbi:MAG: transglutaminase-like domain-containing protein [Nitrososphaerales archaeon]
MARSFSGRQCFLIKQEMQVEPWRSQSEVTRVDRAQAAIDDLTSDLFGLREVSQQLVAHYMGASDGSSGQITGERLKEVDSRYADAMFTRLLEMGGPKLARSRAPEERLAGCCRDFAVLFVAMARHKGFPARIRVGYATYFRPGWYVDHVIAEVWDSESTRWRLVEPEISETIAANNDFDPLNVPPDKFVTGPRAWLLARSGKIDPERFVVAPDLQIPYTRSWPSLRHHLVQDLAALSKLEMLVWDQWGVLNEDDPLHQSEMLDRLARAIENPNCSVEVLLKWSALDGLRVPPIIVSYSPTQEPPISVDVRRVLEGLIKL